MKKKLIALGIDTGATDGQVLTTNINKLNTLNVSSSSIADLTGIQDFVALTNLNCDRNQLTNLDVSKNTTLQSLSCGSNKLSTLDVSKNLSLSSLYCSGNLLANLDVSKNLSLKTFWCGANKLTSIDVSKNLLLDSFLCFENQLTSIDVSKNLSLTALACTNNKLTNLDVSKNLNLIELTCATNLLTTLDISKNVVLKTIVCAHNNLSSLNLKNGNNTKFSISMYEGFIDNPNLNCIIVDDAPYSDANWSNKKDATALFSPMDCSLITKIPDAKFEDKLIALNIDTDGKNGVVLNSSISTITTLDVSNALISDLRGIQGFIALKSLNCSGNLLKKVDLSKNTAFTTLNSSNNPNLICIQVADVAYATANWTTTKDAIASFSLDCTVYTLIPDAKFEDKLIALGIDKDGKNGKVATESIASVTSLNVTSGSITDLTGIQDFKALVTLYCFSNQLTTLDVSKNVALAYLNCEYNQLTTLDVSKNVSLTSLYCNTNKLTSLNLKNGKNNLLTNANINFTSNTDLSCILVDDVAYSNTNWSSKKDATAFFSPIDCSLITKIPDAKFEDKLIALGIDTDGKNGLIANTSIVTVVSLDVSSSSISDLTGIQGFSALKILNCSGNLLKKIDLSKNTAFTTLNCSNNPNLICIQVADVAYATANWTTTKDVIASYSLDCTVYTLIPDAKFEDKLIALGIDKDGKNGKVVTESIASVNTLDVSSSSISNLTGIQDFKSLTTLNCIGNQLTSLDVSKNVALNTLTCYSNQLTSLDVSKNLALNTLSCYSNQLTSLDVSKNVALTALNCSSNKLTSLNLKNGKNTLLTTANISLTNNPNLQCILVDDVTYANTNWSSKKDVIATFNIDCTPYTLIPDSKFEDKLISIGIDTDGKNGKVRTSSINTRIDLDVSAASITDLTGIEDFAALKILRCSDNLLTALNVTKNTLLITLFCEKNQLSSVNVSSNLNLDYLVCHTNQLTSLDVSSNLALTYLSSGLNQLTNLDVSKNTKLTSLYCNQNKLTKLNIKNGNNKNITALIATKNPTLTCIQVDDAVYADSFAAPFFKDAEASYSTSCSPLGIEDSVFDKVAIYPNPTQGELHVDNIVLEKATVYDAMGKLVKTTTFTSGANNNTIRLEGFPKGIYYIYLESEGANTAKKIIVE